MGALWHKRKCGEDWRLLAQRRLRKDKAPGNYHAGRDEMCSAWPLKSKLRTNGAEGCWQCGRTSFQIHCGTYGGKGTTVQEVMDEMVRLPLGGLHLRVSELLTWAREGQHEEEMLVRSWK